MPNLPTALIAGVLLFGFGSGPIRSFATSLTRPTELPI
jgi:preprotein translocase subunit SecD